MAKIVRARTRWLAAAVGAAALVPVPAQAQVTPAARVNWAKTNAILGGAPSALQAILADQKAAPAPAVTPLRPASFALPALRRPAIVRDEAPVETGLTSGRPDVFGSVALKVGSTPLNARWRRVERARITGEAARFAAALDGRDRLEQLEAVNRYVNARVTFTDDSRQHGSADVWSAAAETLRRGRGDCEDYAIAKLQMLRRAGFADRDLYLVIVKDLVSRSDHAVLVVRADAGMYVLDNGTDTVLESSAIRDYRPILTFAAASTWTHGYRVRPVPVDMAAAEAAPLAPAADNQRSRSASLLALSTGFSK